MGPSQTTTPNSQNHLAPRKRSGVKRWKSNDTSSDEEISDETAAKRLSSRIKSKGLNKSKEDAGSQDSRRSQNLHPDDKHSVPKRMKTLSKLPNTWCRTKLSTVNHTFRWTIENFSLLSLKKPGEAVWSQFKASKLGEHDCRLIIFPNGHNANCKNNICLFVQLTDNNVVFNYELKLRSSHGTKVTSSFRIKTQIGNKENRNSGVCHIAKRNELLSLLGEGDTLVVMCSLSINNNVVYEDSKSNTDVLDDSQNKLQVLNDIYELRSKKEFCDMTVCIENEEFPAHKCILAARSSYFRQLLKSFKDKKQIKVRIDGAKSSIFKELLCFLYTGRVLNMEKTANELFEAACLFGLPVLKNMCQNYFKENLSLDNAFDILTLAEKFKVLDFKQYLIKYIVAHRTDIVNFSAFSNKLSPDLVIEILQECYA